MIGTRIKHYEIQEEVGRGGMATVYRAIQLTTERAVAIKVIHQDIQGDQVMLQRFQREARVIARLEHPHILPVFDFDAQYAPPFIVMRYMDSGTLEDILTQDLLDLRQSVRVLRQIAMALDYAHRQGVVHRDIKPSNILLDREGNAFVTDFGIARMVARPNTVPSPVGGTNNTTTLTETGFALGTPDYMSPEQGRGQDDVDHRADIYALGVMFFQMVTGQKPYQANTAVEVIIKHIHDPIPSIRALRGTLPALVDEIIHAAMAKNASERYPTSADMVEELDRLAESLQRGVSSRRTSTLRPPAGITEAHPTTTLRQMDPETFMAATTGYDQQAQKRVVTVMCVEAGPYRQLVETQKSQATAITALKSFFDQATSIIKALGGEVAAREGDRLTIMWGVRVAHQKDAENAISAAFRLQKLLRDIGGAYFYQSDTMPTFPLHIGITVGGVLMSSDNGSLSFNATGSTLALADWLTEHAAGTILVSKEIFVSTRQKFEFEAGPSVSMAGRAEAVPSYRVRDMKAGNSAIPLGMQELPASPDEFKVLMDAYYAAIRDGKTQLMTVKARAGANKSRLLEQFFEWVNHQPEKPLYFQAVGVAPDQRHYAYSLLHDLFSAQFELHSQDSQSVIQQKIERGVAALIPNRSRAIAHFLGHLLGYDFSNSPHIASFRNDPQRLEQFARDSVIHFFAETAQHGPILIHLEDIQWADGDSARLINQLVEQHPNLPLLIIGRLSEREDSEPTASDTRRPPRPSKPIQTDRLTPRPDFGL